MTNQKIKGAREERSGAGLKCRDDVGDGSGCECDVDGGER